MAIGPMVSVPTQRLFIIPSGQIATSPDPRENTTIFKNDPRHSCSRYTTRNAVGIGKCHEALSELHAAIMRLYDRESQSESGLVTACNEINNAA